MRRTATDAIMKPGTVRRRSIARTLTCDADLPNDLVEALWSGDVERLVFSAVPLQVKDRCTAVRLDHASGTFILKRHTWGSLGRTLRSAWRASVARGSLRLGRRLAGLGIPTPRPRACLEQRIGLIGYRSYLLTDYVEGESLYHYIRSSNPTAAQLEHLAMQVTAIWQQLVALGISHNDMKPENFIVDPSQRVWLIDLERVRFHRHKGRMRRRQIGDVRTFLHPRAWRNQSEARRAFEMAFQNTAHSDWLRDIVNSQANSESNIADERLTVLILCDHTIGDAQVQKTVTSVRHLADEIVLVDRSPQTHQPSPQSERPWVLVLHSGEQITPLLAIDLEEAISDRAAADAYRIRIERSTLGCRVPDRKGAVDPVRLFNHRRCSYSVAGGALAMSVDPERTGQLDGTIQHETHSDVAEYVRALNVDSTRAAAERFEQGERARLGRAIFQSLRQFIGDYALGGAFRDGWAGFQWSLLGAFARWLEEVKLWQMGHEFRSESTSEIAGDPLEPSAGRLPNRPDPVWLQRRQAA